MAFSKFCQWIYLVLSFIHLHYFLVSAAGSLCHAEESSALLKLKGSFSFDSFASEGCDAIGVSSHSKMEFWKNNTDCCTWDGVTCDKESGRVIGLDLSCSWLKGSIQSDSSLFSFHYLRNLNLAFNSFDDSSMPSEFGILQNLTHFNLSNSVFTGPVPSEISHLSKLVSLDLSTSLYSLTIEEPTLTSLAQNLSKLEKLVLDQVDMSSASADSFMNLSSSLAFLSLFNCDLQGEFPTSVFHLPKLENLVLSNNPNLTGHIPEIKRGSALKLLDLSSTSISGELPFSIGNLNSLERLVLSQLKNALSIPASIGNLTQLTHLNLENNYISGEIPSSLSNLHGLAYLELGHITLEVCLPDFFGNMTKLEYLDLSYTHPGVTTDCQLPAYVFDMSKLSYLNLQGCQFGGSFPSQIKALPNLVSLDLSHNSLTGNIPFWLFSLPSLEELYLQNNQLSGQIDDFRKSYSLSRLFLNNNMLNGSISRSISNFSNLTSLSLASNNFSGTIDFEMFSTLNLEFLDLSNNYRLSWITKNVSFELPSLITLYLASCNISEFPIFLQTLNSLERLDLANNKIRGKFPKWMSNQLFLWDNLDLFDIRSNFLEGQLPIPPPTAKYFFVSNNKFSGEIPSLVCNASSLEVLDLSNNSLSGMIPRCLGNFSTTLSVLDLRLNNFRGSIPQTFSVCNNLNYFNLNGNKLEGQVPRDLINCQSLEVLDIGDNLINDTFPTWLGTLPNLKVLVLHQNRFRGHLSKAKTKSPFPQLRILDLSSNQFTGNLTSGYFQQFKAIVEPDERESQPSYIGDGYYRYSVDYPVEVTIKGSEREMDNILTFFATIDLSSNRFTGGIPSNVGKLAALKGLNLSHNDLTGQIPTSIINLTNLEWLDFSSNNLKGRIPNQLPKLASLAKLNLSYNQLTGPIPTGRQFYTFTNDSFVGNSGLCGAPLSRKCNNNEDNSPPSESSFKESIWGFNWRTVLMGYGCGTVFGLVMGYIVILTGRPTFIVRVVQISQQKKARKAARRK